MSKREMGTSYRQYRAMGLPRWGALFLCWETAAVLVVFALAAIVGTVVGVYL